MNCRGIKAETLIAQRVFDGSAEGHELRFDALQLRQGAHGKKHFVEQSPADGFLVQVGET